MPSAPFRVNKKAFESKNLKEATDLVKKGDKKLADKIDGKNGNKKKGKLHLKLKDFKAEVTPFTIVQQMSKLTIFQARSQLRTARPTNSAST